MLSILAERTYPDTLKPRVRTEESHRIGALNFRGSTFQAFDPNSSRGTSDDRHLSIGSQGLPAARGSITAPQLNVKAQAVCHSKLSAKIISREITRSGRFYPSKSRPKRCRRHDQASV